jgi:hypothetical protein
VKLQLQTGSLRLRVSEADLAQLLQGQPLRLDLVAGGMALFRLEVRLHEAPCTDRAGYALHIDGPQRWRLVLPAPVIAAYARTLPRRDALVLEPWPQDGTGAALGLLFEVDVRDSVRVRGAGDRPARP